MGRAWRRVGTRCSEPVTPRRRFQAVLCLFLAWTCALPLATKDEFHMPLLGLLHSEPVQGVENNLVSWNQGKNLSAESENHFQPLYSLFGVLPLHTNRICTGCSHWLILRQIPRTSTAPTMRLISCILLNVCAPSGPRSLRVEVFSFQIWPQSVEPSSPWQLWLNLPEHGFLSLQDKEDNTLSFLKGFLKDQMK